ncbi:hypothetical protein C3L33_12576, partial [Rhododendron williamsianum]
MRYGYGGGSGGHVAECGGAGCRSFGFAVGSCFEWWEILRDEEHVEETKVGPRVDSPATFHGGSTTPHRRRRDWCYSSEWWGTKSDGHTVFRATSDKGKASSPSSLTLLPNRYSLSFHLSVRILYMYPVNKVHWQRTQQWLQQRYAEIHPDCESNVPFRILGYQWRTLRFNDDTRQSAVKIMAAYRESDPGSVCFMQQAHCLAVPYVKSMVSTGLATLASCNYDLKSAVLGKKVMNILCIGHGGGTLPLFLGSKIQGWKRAVVHIVEIDPLVISASIQAMGFPPALEKRLHPDHGTVVVNLHADSDIPDSEASVSSVLHKVLPMGKYVSGVCRAYKDVLVENGSGFAFTVAVPWVCNTSLVVCKGSGIGCGILERDLVLNPLASKSQEVETMLDLPFSCLEYIKRGFTLVD